MIKSVEIITQVINDLRKQLMNDINFGSRFSF